MNANSLRTSQVIAVTLGVAGPIAVAVALGNGQIGTLASLGALAMGDGVKNEKFRAQVKSLVCSFIAGCAAVWIGATLAGSGIIAGLYLPAAAAVTGLLGGMSRLLARNATIFLIFSIIALNLGERGVEPMGVTLMFALGASLTGGLALALYHLGRSLGAGPIANPATQPQYTLKQIVKRWRRSLTHLSGWLYTFRLTSCVAVGEVFDWVWPHHHGYWVFITLAIVVHRRFSIAWQRTRQRLLGTLLGVMVASLFSLWLPSLWIMVGLIAVLAALRTLLKEVNYAAYAIVLTPLVILLLDFGKPFSFWVVADRLLATLFGGGVALIFGYWLWIKIFPKALKASA